MNLTELLNKAIEDTYHATDGLMALVDDSELDWKPATGDNWMTTGQLLRHIETACGGPAKGFVTGDWGMDPEMNEAIESGDPSNMLPPAEALKSAESVAASRAALAEDKKLALAMVAQAGEDDLAHKDVSAPWDPRPAKLGYMLLDMVHHLASHKCQLYYYLKLQGKPVHTGTLWGMPEM